MSALNLERVRSVRPQNELHYFASVNSTMTVAAALIEDGAPHNTVVIAEEQTAGIGRLGRSWISEEHAGIYASTVLRLPLPPAQLPIASLLIGLAAAEAIQTATELACDLRWPNDVLIDEHKVAGILPQLVNQSVIAGVGINVNNRGFPPGLRTPATSLYLASGRLQSRETVLIRLLEALETFSDLLIQKGPDAILRAFTAASTYVWNRRVITEENGARGVTAGLDQYGFLLLRSDDGQLQRVSSGGVRPDRLSSS